MAEMEPLDELTQDCVEACTECELVCTEAVTHCLRTGAQHAESDHVNLLLDCASVCGLTVTMMLRRSEFSQQACGLCADVCDRCADSCDQLADDEWMQDCAEVSRNCAAVCREMAGEAAGGEEEIAA